MPTHAGGGSFKGDSFLKSLKSKKEFAYWIWLKIVTTVTKKERRHPTALLSPFCKRANMSMRRKHIKRQQMIYAAFYEHVTSKWTGNKWEKACLQRLTQNTAKWKRHTHTQQENVTAVSFCFAPCWCLLEFHVTKSGTRTSPNTPPTASTDSWHCKVTSCHHQTLHLRLKVTLQHHIITLRSPNTAPATEALCSTRLVSTLRCSALLYSLFKSPQTWKFLNSTSFDIKYQHISILFHILWVCMYTYHMHSYACITEIPFLNLVTVLKLVRVIVVGLQSWTASPGIS